MERIEELNLLGDIPDLFESVKTFKLRIPYCDFRSYIDNFVKRFRKEFLSFDSRISDNLNRSVQKLRAGNSYEVTILEIKRKVGSSEVIKLIKDQKALFPGIYGAMFIWEFNKIEILSGRTNFFFGDNSEEVPQIYEFDSGECSFNLGYLSYNLHPGDYVVFLKQYNNQGSTLHYGSSPWDSGCPWGPHGPQI